MKNKQKNKYYRRSPISERQFRRLLRCFALDLEAYAASQLTAISHRSCKVIYGKLRRYLLKNCLPETADHGEFARGKCHVNGIESFWSYAKRRLAKFNELAEHTFYLHLKETEWRFNMRRQNL